MMNVDQSRLSVPADRRSASSRLHRSHQALLTAAVLAALAVPAAAQGALRYEELPRRGLPVDPDGYTNAVALADLDGDGDLDLVCGDSPSGYPAQTTGQTRVFVNDGMGAFTDVTATRMPVDTDWTSAVALGDVDGDGDIDLVLGNAGSPGQSQNRLYLNDGTGTFSDATASRMPSDNDWTTSVALGDVDGDGDLDLVLGNSLQQNRLYLNDGAGAFSDATASGMPVDADRTHSVALGDVDGDGDLDLVIGNADWGGQRLYLNDGTGTFSDATASRMPADSGNTNSVALGDVDGDSDLDMVIGNFTDWGAQNRLYLNDGSGAFTDATATQMPAVLDLTRVVVLGDVDGDGDLDLISSGWSQYYGANPEPCRLYRNDGGGGFSDVTAEMPPAFEMTQALALGDVDGDGDLDVVRGNFHGFNGPSGQNRLYLNLQRQLHAPNVPQLGQPYGLDAYLRYGPSSTVDLAAIYLSTAPASIQLPPFGTLGIDPAQAAPFPTLIIPQPAGASSVGFTVPTVPSLVGQEIFSQAMLVAYPNDLRLSNVVRDVIQ